MYNMRRIIDMERAIHQEIDNAVVQCVPHGAELQFRNFIRSAYKNNVRIHMAFSEEGCVVLYSALIVAIRGEVCAHQNGDTFYVVKLKFDGDDPTDDGWQCLWESQMMSIKEELTQEAKWCFERFVYGCSLCNYSDNGCVQCN